MKKYEELSNPSSCMNLAKDNEIVFVLLARDVAAPAAIRAWTKERIRRGKNKPGDLQISEALDCAKEMEIQAVLRAGESDQGD